MHRGRLAIGGAARGRLACGKHSSSWTSACEGGGAGGACREDEAAPSEGGASAFSGLYNREGHNAGPGAGSKPGLPGSTTLALGGIGLGQMGRCGGLGHLGRTGGVGGADDSRRSVWVAASTHTLVVVGAGAATSSVMVEAWAVCGCSVPVEAWNVCGCSAPVLESAVCKRSASVPASALARCGGGCGGG